MSDEKKTLADIQMSRRGEGKETETITQAVQGPSMVANESQLLNCTPRFPGLVEEIRVRGKVKVKSLQIAMMHWVDEEQAKAIFPGDTGLWRSAAFEQSVLEDGVQRLRIPHRCDASIDAIFKPGAPLAPKLDASHGFPVIQEWLPLYVHVIATENTTVDMQVDYTLDPLRTRPIGRLMLSIDSKVAPETTMLDIADELERFASFLRCERPKQGGGSLRVKGVEIGHWELCAPSSCEQKGRT